MRLALVVVAGDPHHVFAVGGGEVGVGVDQRLSHPLRVLDVLAENDGLGETVCRLQKLRDLHGDNLGALFEDQVPVEVPVVVFPILNELSELVPLAGLGAPAIEILVEADADDLVGREEAVGNALPERVGVNRVAEVFDVGNVLGFLRCRGQADLGGGGVILEDLAPRGILVGAPAVTLVHEDEIEEVRRKLLVDVLLLLGARDGLVEAEVNLERFVHGAVRDLGHRRAERFEIVGLRLVSQDVAIHEEEDALFRPRLPQAPDDLKRGVGLARAGGHDKQGALFTARDGVHGAVDGDGLVVVGNPAGAVVVVMLPGDGLLLGGVALGLAVALPEFVGRGELVEGDFAGHGAAGDGAIVLQKRIAVRAVGKGDVENLRVFERLLHPGADGVVVVLPLDDGEREVRPVIEQVVGLLGFTAFHGLAAHDDAALGEIRLLADLGHQIPFVVILSNQCGGDELRADVRLGESFLVHWAGDGLGVQRRKLEHRSAPKSASVPMFAKESSEPFVLGRAMRERV